MHPLDPQVHYGISDRNYLDIHDVQMELLPDKLHQLRWKLHQKAKNEPKFRFSGLSKRPRFWWLYEQIDFPLIS